MLAGADITVGVACAGLLSFLSPCILPLVPPYLIALGAAHLSRRPILPASLFFVAGFAAVFVASGAGASTIGQLIAAYKPGLEIAFGLVIVAYGFVVLANMPLNHPAAFAIGAVAVGVAFALGWTPCVGPILQTILALAARPETLAVGVWLLLVYAVGLSLPFVLMALALRPIMSAKVQIRLVGMIRTALGTALLATGLVFVTGTMTELSGWMIETFPGLATIEETLTPPSLKSAIMNHSRQR